MNLDFIKTFVDVLIHPTETLRKEKENASLGKGVVYFLFSFLIPLILWGLFALISNSLKEGYPGLKIIFSLMFQELIKVSIILLPSLIIFHVITFTLAKFFKGKGTIKEQVYLVSLAMFPIIFIFVLIGFFLFYAFFFYFIFMLFVAIIIISYISTIALLETHEFTNISMLIKLFITISLFILIFILLFFSAGITSNLLKIFSPPTTSHTPNIDYGKFDELINAI